MRRPSRRTTALIAAGVVALGAGGAALGVAASSGGGNAPAAALAEQINKNEGTTLTEADIRQAMRDILKARLDDAVAAGRLTRGQADEELKRFDQAPQRRAEHERRREAMIAPVAKVLGMTAEQIHDARHSGTTLADLAKQKNVSRDRLLDAIKEGLEAAPRPGGGTPTDAELTRMAERIADGTGDRRGFRGAPGGPGERHHPGPGGGPGLGFFGP